MCINCNQYKKDIHTENGYCLRYKRPEKFAIKVCNHRSNVFNLKKHGKICAYCGKELSWSKRTIDHLIPKSIQENNSLYNLLICCQKCNVRKGDTKLKEFRKDVDKDIIMQYLSQYIGTDVNKDGKYVSHMLHAFKIEYGEFSKKYLQKDLSMVI